MAREPEKRYVHNHKDLAGLIRGVFVMVGKEFNPDPDDEVAAPHKCWMAYDGDVNGDCTFVEPPLMINYILYWKVDPSKITFDGVGGIVMEESTQGKYFDGNSNEFKEKIKLFDNFKLY